MSIRLLFVFSVATWGACVTGRAVDATAEPVGGGTVELITRAFMEAVQRLGWDSLFRFCNAPASEYKVLIKVQGFRVRRTAAFVLDPAQRVELGDVAIVLEIKKGRKRRLADGLAPVLSPDTRRVVFLRSREDSGAVELWAVESAGKSVPVQVSQPVRAMWNLRFEGNDRVVYETTTWETGDVSVTLPLGGGSVKA